jgi:hypothetical protein
VPRKSAAALSTVAVISDSRPQPPADLTEPDQQAEWDEICRSLPQGWFKRPQYPLLAAYCRHASAIRTLTKMIDRFQPEWMQEDAGFDRFSKMLVARQNETKMLVSIGTKLRITLQAQYAPHVAARAAQKQRETPPPWGQSA